LNYTREENISPQLSNSQGTNLKPWLNRRLPFLGTVLDPLNETETLEAIRTIIANRLPTQHCVLNSFKLFLIHHDTRLQKIVNECGLVQADGVSIVWAGRILRFPFFPRITGIDLMSRLLSESNEKQYRVFFLGASENVLKQTLTHVSSHYPKLMIAGHHHGYFDQAHEKEVIRRISDSKADILFVAFGSPKKEYWLSENLNNLNVPFCMGVGGSFDVLAGLTKRAPQWMQKFGLEWFYRFIQEPGRMWKRYLISNSYFLWLIIKEWMKRENHR
jgi:N-acetylglucosaminyldiphosphoundecaprenol N-acetyl-beta-D-mannosaminyltransferase